MGKATKDETYAGTSHSETAKWKCIELCWEKSGKRVGFSTIVEFLAELNDRRVSKIAGAALINCNQHVVYKDINGTKPDHQASVQVKMLNLLIEPLHYRQQFVDTGRN